MKSGLRSHDVDDKDNPPARSRQHSPGETLFWCACDMEHPFWTADSLLRHVEEARAKERLERQRPRPLISETFRLR